MTGSSVGRWMAALLLLTFGTTAHAAPFAYIANADDNTVSVIDTDTNTVTETLAGFHHPVGVALNPTGTRVYVTSMGSGLVHVVDASTHTIVASIPVGTFPNVFPEGIAFNPANSMIYVGAGFSHMTVIDTTTNTVSTTIPITSGGNGTAGVAVNPAGTRVYQAQPISLYINVIDTGTNTEIAAIPGVGGRGIVVHPSGSPLYAFGTELGADVIKMVDTSSNTISGFIPIGACLAPVALAVNAAGTRLYAACGNSGHLAIIDAMTNTLITNVPVGSVPLGVGLTPDGSRAYVTLVGTNEVTVVDTATNSVVDTLSVGDEPRGLGLFIGPDFQCNNGTVEPGEGCDDGIPLGGPCAADCLVPHDTVVVPPKPVKVKLAAGKFFVQKKLKVKVLNADILPLAETPGHSIRLEATSDCPPGTVGFPDFGSGSNVVQLEGGKKKPATIVLSVHSGNFPTFNQKAPTRCTITLTATTTPSIGTSEPSPSNNVATVELNVFDQNDLEQTAVHESVLHSAKPIIVKIKDLATTVTKIAKAKVGNADYLPAEEDESLHSMTVTALDGDCPPLTVGAATFKGAGSVAVAGGKLSTASVPVTVNSGVTSSSKLSPARCTATLAVVGPAGDTDASNNTTKLVIDVIDQNDF